MFNKKIMKGVADATPFLYNRFMLQALFTTRGTCVQLRAQIACSTSFSRSFGDGDEYVGTGVLDGPERNRSRDLLTEQIPYLFKFLRYAPFSPLAVPMYSFGFK